jgi:hypothetical protein
MSRPHNRITGYEVQGVTLCKYVSEQRPVAIKKPHLLVLNAEGVAEIESGFNAEGVG